MKQGAPDVLLYLVGNKSDLKEDRVVKPAEAEKLGKRLKMLGYTETSAKDGSNVKELFQTISQLLLEHNQMPIE